MNYNACLFNIQEPDNNWNFAHIVLLISAIAFTSR